MHVEHSTRVVAGTVPILGHQVGKDLALQGKQRHVAAPQHTMHPGQSFLRFASCVTLGVRVGVCVCVCVCVCMCVCVCVCVAHVHPHRPTPAMAEYVQ